MKTGANSATVVALGLLYDRVRWEEKLLVKRARSRGLRIQPLDVRSAIFDAHASSVEAPRTFGDIALQRCISHYRGLFSTAVLESKGIPVVNSFQIALTCGNKLLTTLALERAGVPTPRTLLAFSREAALEEIERLGYPAILKPVTGSWGRMVTRLKDREMAEMILEMRDQMNGTFSQIYYLQEHIVRPPRDIRTIAIDGRIVAAIYRTAPAGEWRTNVARGARPSLCPITPELEERVAKASEAVGGGVLGVDAMEAPSGIIVHEVNNTVEFRGAASVSSVDIAGEILDHVVKVRRK